MNKTGSNVLITNDKHPKTILVTGASGQLGSCIRNIAYQFPMLNFVFTDKYSLDISDFNAVYEFFKQNKINWCINCAAYTAVDSAEDNKEIAYKINVFGTKNLAKVCEITRCKLIHISTDFIFDGNKNISYTEEDIPNPINIYGRTKLEGEIEIISSLNDYFILRTSWLYSEFGHNFMNTMLKLAKTEKELSIVDNQISTPTYAQDLAEFMMFMIMQDSNKFGVYNYSNEGVASWYDFAKAIFEISNIKIKTKPIPSSDFYSPVKRPVFSVLDKTKLKKVFNIELPYWRESLIKSLRK